jgi:type II secretion system protein C
MWRKIFDELFTRYIFIIDLFIIVILAAFLAAAIDQSISGRIDGAVSRYRELSSSAPLKSKLIYGKGKQLKTQTTFKTVDGKAILSRNFFDSETGPLDEQALGLQDFMSQDAYAPSAEDMSSMPPRCSAPITIVGLFAADDPDWAFAAVQSNNETQILQIGDTIQSFMVNDISWKYLFLGQSGSSTSCYLDIWQDEVPVKTAKPSGQVLAGNTPPPPKNAFEEKKEFQGLLNSSISDVSETEKNIDKQLVDYLLENKQMLMQSGRILPNIENEEINGFKVYGIRKTSLWGKLGVQNGDVIKSVNGIAFTGPDSALEAFGNLQNSDHLTVNVTRRGQDMNLDINIK